MDVNESDNVDGDDNEFSNVPSMSSVQSKNTATNNDFPLLPLISDRSIVFKHYTPMVNGPNLDTNNRKRNHEEVVLENDCIDLGDKGSKNKDSAYPPAKRDRVSRVRLYDVFHSGPYEVVISSKDKIKINPFKVGKMIEKLHYDVHDITRAGRNLVVNCKSHTSANRLVSSSQFPEFNLFIPSHRVEVVGLINIDTDIDAEEIVEEAVSSLPIVDAYRITKHTTEGPIKTSMVKVTFQGDRIPREIKLNYVVLPVREFVYRVQQCFRCYRYGHSSRTCRNERICKICVKSFHGPECNSNPICLHCKGTHDCASTVCPEFVRQQNIRQRMTQMRENFMTASKYFPKTYISQQNVGRYAQKSYAGIVQSQVMSNLSVANQEHNYSVSSVNRFDALSQQQSKEEEVHVQSANNVYSWSKPKRTFRPHNLTFHQQANNEKFKKFDQINETSDKGGKSTSDVIAQESARVKKHNAKVSNGDLKQLFEEALFKIRHNKWPIDIWENISNTLPQGDESINPIMVDLIQKVCGSILEDMLFKVGLKA